MSKVGWSDCSTASRISGESSAIPTCSSPPIASATRRLYLQQMATIRGNQGHFVGGQSIFAALTASYRLRCEMQLIVRSSIRAAAVTASRRSSVLKNTCSPRSSDESGEERQNGARDRLVWGVEGLCHECSSSSSRTDVCMKCISGPGPKSNVRRVFRARMMFKLGSDPAGTMKLSSVGSKCSPARSFDVSRPSLPGSSGIEAVLRWGLRRAVEG